MYTVVWSLLLSMFSTAVLTYVALATPVGPWVGPMLALATILTGSLFCRSQKDMVLTVCAGSLGGIIATGIGFSFPTLYFLDEQWFGSLVAHPLQFFTLVVGLVIAAGLCGLLCARYMKKDLIEDQQLAFPVGQLVHKIISAQSTVQQTRQLLAGLGVGIVYTLLQVKRFLLIPLKLDIWKNFSFGIFKVAALSLDLTMLPMFLALGFIAGHMMTVPLIVGALIKTFVLDPFHALYFGYLPAQDFMFSVCSGIVISGALASLIAIPQELFKVIKRLSSTARIPSSSVRTYVTKELLSVAAVTTLFLSWHGFSFVSQLYLVIGTVLCSYQIAAIAGKTGLALLGRFATFVMVPGILLFRFNPLQIAVVATFVEVCAGVTTEALFGYKTGDLAQVDNKKMYQYQILGLVVSACAVAMVLYLLVTHFQLGSEQLFAQRAYARALLVNAASCDLRLLGIGVVFGYCLKFLKLNPMLLLGGLLMPLPLVVMLSVGGLLSYVVRNKGAYEPFCSGVYAANALLILVRLFI